MMSFLEGCDQVFRKSSRQFADSVSAIEWSRPASTTRRHGAEGRVLRARRSAGLIVSSNGLAVTSMAILPSAARRSRPATDKIADMSDHAGLKGKAPWFLRYAEPDDSDEHDQNTKEMGASQADINYAGRISLLARPPRKPGPGRRRYNPRSPVLPEL